MIHRRETKSAYQKALFDAFVWPQAVEEQVRDLVDMFDNAGCLKLSNKDRSKVKKATFGRLIQWLRPCICADLFERLERLRYARNDVVHRSSFVTNILVWEADPDRIDHHANEEIKRFKEIKTCAGDLYGKLLDLTE